MQINDGLTQLGGILLGSLVIGGAILGSQFVGRYQIATTAGADGVSVLWLANMRTGDIQLCEFTQVPYPTVKLKEPEDPNNPFNGFPKAVAENSAPPPKRFDLQCKRSIGPGAPK